MGKKSYELGREGEEVAARFLEQQGIKIIEKNFRSHQGEVDIVARDEKYLVFVEVKYYSFRSFSVPLYAVRRNKKDSIIHAARLYLHKHKQYDEPCRFDVVAIYKNRIGQTIVEHIKNAFGVH
jgi:putative endonuclease